MLLLIAAVFCIAAAAFLLSVYAVQIKYICRVSSHGDLSDAQNSTLQEPFLDDADRDRLISAAVCRHFKSFAEPVTVEIQNTRMLISGGKDTALYTVHAVDADGFSGLVLIWIQPRWQKKAIGQPVNVPETVIPTETNIIEQETNGVSITQTPLSLDVVTDLSACGYKLSWSDFSEYVHTDVGSGLYIWHFPIDETFSLKVGGGNTQTAPMYIRLTARRGEEETHIDIRDGGVDEFIREYTQSDDFILTVTFANERTLSGMTYHEHIVNESEYTQLLLFRPKESLTDIRFTSMDFTEDGFRPLKELYTLDALNPEKPLVIGVVFPGDLTTYGIFFKDSGGISHQCIVYISGRDGMPVIQEYTPSA
ncbi:MAG: hypothetical protein E7662_08140 [Ruminococcaceae bacterium]|nr:hypothetical protein [Oscillospiraceae bacterium]